MNADETARGYRAFISYRHKDDLEENRRWAQWLHGALESYQVPRDLIRAHQKRDLAFPGHLYPIFHDEKELRPGDLDGLIAGALARSDSLVVLCTPHERGKQVGASGDNRI
jgi:hypothetical protein